MRSIRWAIIGAGDVAEVKSGPAFYKLPGSKLHAVMRRDADKARDFAQRHGVKHWYASMDPVLADSGIDAVYIATPPSSHAELAITALRAGKSVYLEKPMAMNAAECGVILEAAETATGKLVVAHYRRRLPNFLKVAELIAEGAIGAPRKGEIRLCQPPKPDLIAGSATDWRVNPEISGGGLFHDLAPHQIDLMLMLFGQPERYHGISLRRASGPGCDDAVYGQILFPGNVVVSGEWDFTSSGSQAEDSCVITGEAGWIRFSFFGSNVEVFRSGTSQTYSFTLPQHVQQPMIAAVNDFFRGEGSCPCSGLDGMTVIKVMDAFTGRS